ncbi:TonB-dependent receptor [bacterium]|nr:TonB-dependent receptor [bacterium]
MRAFFFASVSSLGFSALAQEAAEQQTPVDAAGPQTVPSASAEGDVIQITGRRPLAESEAAALEIQRASDNVVSVLSADAIGNLPDQNIAFAVGRLPGVGIQRDQGQARYVNLRGTPIRWTTLSFDGVSVVSPEGRNSRFDNIPSALAKQVIVNKAITPDMPGDTVAGNIDIITRSAFDNPGLDINGKVGLGLVSFGGGEEVDSSIVASNRFLDGRLGVLLQASYYRRNMVTDNQETDPYLVPRTARPNDRVPRETEHKLYRLTRENQSLSFRTDYQIDSANELFFSSIWTNYTDEELRNNYIFRFDQGTDAAGRNYNSARDAGTIDPVQGVIYGARINMNTNSLESEEDIYTSTLGGNHFWSGWDMKWRANYTYTADGRDAPAAPNWQSPSSAADRPTLSYDFRDNENHQIRLFRTAVNGSSRAAGTRVNAIEDLPVTFVNISKQVGGDETQAYTLKVDAERELDFAGMPVKLKTGALWTDRTKKSDDTSWTATRNQLVAAGIEVPEITATGSTGAYDQLFLNKPYLGRYGLGYSFRYHSKSALEKFANDLVLSGVATRNDTSGNFWKVGEQILGGYGMAKVDFDWGNIVGGVRVENITNTGFSNSSVGFITVENEDTLVYPSAHINWDINNEMKLRIGATSTASRPDFSVLRPNLTFNDTAQTVSGGNPEATPEKQIGLDAYFEWYMEPEGFFSAGVFYKDITDVLFTQADDFGLDILNTGGIDRSGYLFTTTRNGGDGYLQGFEMFFSKTAQSFVDNAGLPDWLGGFGLRASATWVDSEVTVPAVLNASGVVVNPERKITLPGTSDEVYNLQLTYEKYGLSMRLAYQFRTAWLNGVGSYVIVGGQLVPNGNGDNYWDDDGELDFSIRYQVSDNIEWFFDAVNLTNQNAIRYADSKNFPIEDETFGERYIMGVRFNF